MPTANSKEPLKNASGDVNVDYPLTSPSQKAYNDRLDQEAAGKFAKPEPVDAHLLREGIDGTTNVAVQQPAEFEKSGGQTVMSDNSSIEPPKEAPKKGTK